MRNRHLQRNSLYPCSVSYDFCSRKALRNHRTDAAIWKFPFRVSQLISKIYSTEKNTRRDSPVGTTSKDKRILHSWAENVINDSKVAHTHFLGTVDT